MNLKKQPDRECLHDLERLLPKAVTWPSLNFIKLAHQKEVSFFLPKSHAIVSDLERWGLKSKASIPGKTHFWF